MGFIEEYFLGAKRFDDNLIELNIDACTYPAFYRYWRENLFERLMRLFIWENTENEDKTRGVNPKEIEQRNILQGYCVISKIKDTDDELTAFYGSMFTPTKYYDEFKQVNINCPIYSGTRTIHENAVIINNTAMRNPSYALVHHYAVLLAHNEVTLVDMLVDARDNGGVPVAQNQKQLESIRAYQNKKFYGKYGVVTDSGGLGIGYAGSDRKTAQNIAELMETRNKLIRAFYADIGVRATIEKRSNVNSMEIDGDTSMLLLNISDMLHQRERACEEINRLYNLDWRVHIAEEIDYADENETTISEVTDNVEEKTDNTEDIRIYEKSQR